MYYIVASQKPMKGQLRTIVFSFPESRIWFSIPTLRLLKSGVREYIGIRFRVALTCIIANFMHKETAALQHPCVVHTVHKLTIVCFSWVVAIAWSRACTGTHCKVRDVELERSARWVTDGVIRVTVPYRENVWAGSWRSAVWKRMHLYGRSSQQAQYSNNFHYDRQGTGKHKLSDLVCGCPVATSREYTPSDRCN